MPATVFPLGSGEQGSPRPAPPPGTPVPPAWRVGRLDDIEAFKPGIWNGQPYDAAFVRRLADNFHKYSAGPSAHYRPYLSINHDDNFRFGVVDSARLDGDTLRLSAGQVPEPVCAWRNAGAITEPSIEFFEPVYDENGTLIDGFRRADGSIEDGPVLKCVTLLGPDAPAVKGMAQLPVATFSAGGRIRRVRCFNDSTTSGVSTVDRATLLSTLQGLGMETSIITDAVPDEVLQAFLTALQAAAAGGSAGTPPVDAMPSGPPMSDGNLATPAPTVSGSSLSLPSIGSGSGSPTPSQLVVKFADAGGAVALSGYLKAVNDQFDELRKNAAFQAHQAKFAAVRKFVDDLAKPDAKGQARIVPAQKAGLVTLLMKCDDQNVRKFADGKTVGSELEEMKRVIESTYPPVKSFSEKFRDPAVNPGGEKLDPDTRRQILQGSATGRALLARQAKS